MFYNIKSIKYLRIKQAKKYKIYKIISRANGYSCIFKTTINYVI